FSSSTTAPPTFITVICILADVFLCIVLLSSRWLMLSCGVLSLQPPPCYTPSIRRAFSTDMRIFS
ncbi:hypothetical protein, partial [Escherichia coli]|uniref:hypothetical protein n=1 Tax=Escherichia coli TaxID=562 RepID=UPI0028E03894